MFRIMYIYNQLLDKLYKKVNQSWLQEPHGLISLHIYIYLSLHIYIYVYSSHMLNGASANRDPYLGKAWQIVGG